LSSGDEFARELFEDAKHSLKQAKAASSDLTKQRHLRHSLLAAFSFLELQIELIAQHFKDSTFLTLHERGIIAQKEVVFDKGVFRIKDVTRFTRLSERMLLLQHKFSGSKLTEREWWAPLINGTERRNSVAHPRAPIVLNEAQTEHDILAALGCANDLFEIVFGKGLPYASLGSKPKLNK
jgi:hypothetical protein